MGQILKTIKIGKYSCEIRVEDDGRVHFTADAKIDADGANGQNGGPPAYRSDDTGSDYLANGGMGIRNGRVVCIHDWGRDVAILGGDNEPKEFPGKLIASKTSYRYPHLDPGDPAAYVDAETVPYVVIPPFLNKHYAGRMKGCQARVSFKGKSIDLVAVDVGPPDAPGEISIEAARRLGMPHSPKDGGWEGFEVEFEFWPGKAAPGYELQR